MVDFEVIVGGGVVLVVFVQFVLVSLIEAVIFL